MIARFLISLAAAGCLFAEGAGYPVYSACDENADVLAEVQKNAPVTVHFSITGGATCYSVTVAVSGSAVRGYVLDPTLEAVQAFDEARAKNDRASFANPPSVSLSLPTVAPTPAAKPASVKEDTAKAEPKPAKKEPPPPKMSM